MGIINIVNGILWRDGKLLLAKRSAFKTSYANKWSFPGGHVEHGENLKEALARELKEELAVSLADCELIAEIDDPNSTSANLVRYHIFLVTDWGAGELIIMNEEHCQLRWVSPRQAQTIANIALTEYRQVFQQLEAIS
jgi:8-oxo-dGTP diphosphatase